MSEKPTSDQGLKALEPTDSGLWPKFGKTHQKLPPNIIIRQQAEKLGQLTQNIVTATVRPLSMGPRYLNKSVSFEFKIVAPLLGEYSFVLFTFSYDLLDLYPVKIKNMYLDNELGNIPVEARDDIQLRQHLQTIFNHPKTVSAIDALVIQSEGQAASNPDES